MNYDACDTRCHCEEKGVILSGLSLRGVLRFLRTGSGAKQSPLRDVIARNGGTKQSVEGKTGLPRRQKTAARNDGLNRTRRIFKGVK
jgi:hypothetical protein